MSLVYIAGTGVFFAICLAFARFCEQLRKEGGQ